MNILSVESRKENTSKKNNFGYVDITKLTTEYHHHLFGLVPSKHDPSIYYQYSESKNKSDLKVLFNRSDLGPFATHFAFLCQACCNRQFVTERNCCLTNSEHKLQNLLVSHCDIDQN